jgi:hypothetical protein
LLDIASGVLVTWLSNGGRSYRAVVLAIAAFERENEEELSHWSGQCAARVRTTSIRRYGK